MTMRLKQRSDGRKNVLVWAAVGIVVCGLFPPWLYTYDKSGPTDWNCGHWEVSAGYAPILKPPEGGEPKHDFYNALPGVKLDVTRLLVEWVCILAVSGAAWGVVRLNREPITQLDQ